jgi:hypothetical protein
MTQRKRVIVAFEGKQQTSSHHTGRRDGGSGTAKTARLIGWSFRSPIWCRCCARTASGGDILKDAGT